MHTGTATACATVPAAATAPAAGVWAVYFDDSSGLALYPSAASACRAAAGTGREVAFVPFGQDFITVEGGFEFAARPLARWTGRRPAAAPGHGSAARGGAPREQEGPTAQEGPAPA